MKMIYKYIIMMLFIKTINSLVFKKILLNVYLTDLEICSSIQL